MNVILCNVSALICCEMFRKHVGMYQKSFCKHVLKVLLFDQFKAAFIVSKKVKHLQKSNSGRPRIVAVVCSLKCFEIDLICWQLISVKATKHLLGLPF